MKANYDFVIIGSGLGGLISGLILAMEGNRVCILEKNNQYGGNLQTFSRDKILFDTGVHYLGGLESGQNLHEIFQYLGIFDGLKLLPMDKNGYDRISFGDETEDFAHAQSYKGFAKSLIAQFPEEEKAIIAYCLLLKKTCSEFPLYNLSSEIGGYQDLLGLNAKKVIAELTDNKLLQSVLAGSNFLYAGNEKSPWYLHALSVNSYIQSAFRCVHGGSQITRLLVKQLRHYGADLFKHEEVTEISCEENKVNFVKTSSGKIVYSENFIANMELKSVLNLVGSSHFRKLFYNRIQNLKPVISAFSVYIVLKPNTIQYQNCNFYHFQDKNSVWNAQDYTSENWPLSYMLSYNAPIDDSPYASAVTLLTYMKYDEVADWEYTRNTVANPETRPSDYEEFKKQKAEILIEKVCAKFPELKDAIQSYYTSTPLSYRDYIGASDGNMYGYERDSENPLLTQIPNKTKLDNLYLTGQSVSVHGILGVSLGALNLCCDLIGRDYLLSKIKPTTLE